MSNSYKPLQNISKKNPPEVGESVLWRNVKKGRSGIASTKCEYFNATVREVVVEEDCELYLYLD